MRLDSVSRLSLNYDGFNARPAGNAARLLHINEALMEQQLEVTQTCRYHPWLLMTAILSTQKAANAPNS